jgi:RsiW-degrading membrane proteinase PrsW (M82 family)
MDAVALVRLALAVISERMLSILALGLSFSLACWTMWDPRWERLGTMAFFSIFSYLLINIKERTTNERHERISTQE